MLDVTQRATQSQALKKLTAGYELLPPGEDGICYILWSADAAHSKPTPVKAVETEEHQIKPKVVKTFRDPFAKENLEMDLFVTQLHDTHNLVLNKFNVADEHVVLPTIEFAPQEEPLNAADFHAMLTAMKGLDAFAFFNCGFNSGASQPHKHMQLMTYPSMKAITGLDMPPLLHFIDQKLREYPTAETVQLPELPFCHFLHRLDVTTDSAKTAAVTATIYNKVLQQMNTTGFPADAAQAATSSAPSLPVAYNLLLTSSFLFLIPRKTQAFNGIEVNSIGFIGSFFVRNNEQRVFFEMQGGPMKLLREVTFPPMKPSIAN
ncbi:bifunctional AP-4-A phosphorylase/ADP sulfurylase [Phytophthora boehmeriae]|uniref:Bifunctional AP-4-A phosphorylase/ADP sulfurylase n=1 Tax=Phytophthora boehmeriae TaxID=109152 RepID=A0A8T1X714_9STRA|nr:bifunctional AP-4-A phosphorylase/ADP sulfurylase [Phytophthora boehmeriae]